MRPDPVFFDAHLHADGLSNQDLTSMAAFGLRAALVPARDAVGDSVKDYVAHFRGLLSLQSRRLARLGVRAYAALGVHPARIPWHGLEEILAVIPRLAGDGRLVAIGEIGLEQGGPREEQVFERQLELARELNLPVVVSTPERDKARQTRRLLAMLLAAGVAPESALVCHASSQTLKTIRECGFRAGLTLNPVRLGAAEAAGLVRTFGSEGLIASSDAGDGVSDILSLPHAASVMSEAGLSASVVRRVLCDNALAFFKLSREGLDGPPVGDPSRPR